MSATRVRTVGNNPQTRIHCDWSNRQGDVCRELVSDWDAREARMRARTLGWERLQGKDFCPFHSKADNR